MNAFDIYLGYKKIDTVFAIKSLSAEDLKQNLIELDGFDPMITVVLSLTQE